jgi:hypothetical protein
MGEREEMTMVAEHEYKYQTTLDGEAAVVTFTIVRDGVAEKVAGRNLWPITAVVAGKPLRYVVAAGTRLRESRSVLANLASDGFVTNGKEVEPAAGFGTYEPM